jgi:hypothetical protein
MVMPANWNVFSLGWRAATGRKMGIYETCLETKKLLGKSFYDDVTLFFLLRERNCPVPPGNGGTCERRRLFGC